MYPRTHRRCRNYVGTMSELKGLRSMHWVCDLPGLFKALARLRRQLIRSKPRSPSSSSTSHAPHADPLWISRCTRPFSLAHFSKFSIEFNPSIWIQLNSICIRCILWGFIISAAQPDSTWLNLAHEQTTLLSSGASHPSCAQLQLHLVHRQRISKSNGNCWAIKGLSFLWVRRCYPMLTNQALPCYD